MAKVKEWKKRNNRAYRARKLALGQCVACGKPRSADNKRYCEYHRIRSKIYLNRHYHAHKPPSIARKDRLIVLDTGE